MIERLKCPECDSPFYEGVGERGLKCMDCGHDWTPESGFGVMNNLTGELAVRSVFWTYDAACRTCYALNLQAGPGGLYGVCVWSEVAS